MGHLSITGQVQNVPINSEFSRLLCWVGTSSTLFYRWGILTHQETSCPRSQAEAELESRQSDVRAPLAPAYNHQDLHLNIVLMWVELTGPFFHAFFLYVLFIVVVTVILTYYLIKLLRRSHFGKMCSAVKAFSLPPSLSPPFTVYIP